MKVHFVHSFFYCGCVATVFVHAALPQNKHRAKAHLDTTKTNLYVFKSFFLNFLNFLQSPKDIGIKLLNLYCGHHTLENVREDLKLDHAGEVEILIKSYLCFNMSCNTIGCSMILSIVTSKAQVSTLIKSYQCLSLFCLYLWYSRKDILIDRKIDIDISTMGEKLHD
jgi:hypothetical protein